jgi:hypothetical protein
VRDGRVALEPEVLTVEDFEREIAGLWKGLRARFVREHGGLYLRWPVVDANAPKNFASAGYVGKLLRLLRADMPELRDERRRVPAHQSLHPSRRAVRALG